MGYHSKFSFNSNSDKALEIRDAINQKTFPGSAYLFEWWRWGQGPKWYEQKEVCIAVSERYPGEMFTIVRVGEEEGDNWTYTYMDGKVKVRKATEAEVREVENGRQNLQFSSRTADSAQKSVNNP